MPSAQRFFFESALNMASFRRKKSRVGDAFQADVPPLLSRADRDASHRVYSDAMAASTTCDSIFTTANPVDSLRCRNMKIDDTSVAHPVAPRVLDAQRSFTGLDFDYPFYVENYRSGMDRMTQQYYEHKSTSNRRSTRKKNIVNYAEYVCFVSIICLFICLFIC